MKASRTIISNLSYYLLSKIDEIYAFINTILILATTPSVRNHMLTIVTYVDLPAIVVIVLIGMIKDRFSSDLFPGDIFCGRLH